MIQLPDAPDIARTLRTGYPREPDPVPRCPICGRECEDVYYNLDGYIIGCDLCTTVRDAWDVDACFVETL